MARICGRLCNRKLEIDITESAITEFDITDTAIMESDITRKGKLLQRRPRIRAMLNSSARLFVQN